MPLMKPVTTCIRESEESPTGFPQYLEGNNENSLLIKTFVVRVQTGPEKEQDEE